MTPTPLAVAAAPAPPARAQLPRRRVLIAGASAGALGALALLASGCASLNTIHSQVSSFGEWPAGRAPGTYAFERLPSQASQPEITQSLEAAARPGLAKAGFQPVAPGQTPSVLVQVGTRSSRAERGPWEDPLWWRGGVGHYRRGPWAGPHWGLGLHLEPPRYEHEVALLLRDATNSKPLFEARASYEGTGGGVGVAQALFEAALMDFPKTGVNPRSVRVVLPGAR